eukprot:CAMPEP_0201204002 /NCGR_PEP_ID=MMETSP0851-20130426/168018_1 /ASSEMBLY_ACC=CAM_ASM_000631 /TAXON_ID=183588 /ORGANISM="Pseudo-nitzschia fraudulenta, Strain WWA7" /LENGTH=254 /DNA_ID=CAMNT_0047492043 /DNA_START=112 /DNA_END=873 /DNA_ORIENTATION=-
MYGVPVATANAPQATNRNGKMFSTTPSAKSSTKTTATRFNSEISDQTCKDSEDFLFRDNPDKGCKWATKRSAKRCKKTDEGTGILVADACPSACDLRCTCRNKRKEFQFNEKSTRCNKIEESDCSSVADNGNNLADMCPKKCKDCYKHYSFPPKEEGWIQLGSDIDTKGDSDKNHDLAMSSDGSIVAVSTYEVSSGGIVRVHEYSKSGGWAQLGSDIELESDQATLYGFSVSLSSDGTQIAIGAPQHEKFRGIV